MSRHTLADIRTHIEDLAGEAGEYYLVCARHGDRPVPVTDLYFEKRATARAAARATELYRAKLRQYDTRLPYYDIIVCQDTSGQRTASPVQSAGPAPETDDWTLSERVVGTIANEPQSRIEFCHRVAAAVFETLTDHKYGTVETAVLESYFDLAADVDDPDSLCLGLLERMATALDEQLPIEEQATIVTEAAAKLSTPAETDRPVETTLSRLETRGLLDSYAQSVDTSADCTESCRVRLSGYKLSPQDTSLPVLPIVLELTRHRPKWSPPSLQVVDIEDGWQLTVTPATTPEGVASVPISAEGYRQ